MRCSDFNSLMEPILTLDLAESPAKLRVVSYEDQGLKVWDETLVELFPKSEADIDIDATSVDSNTDSPEAGSNLSNELKSKNGAANSLESDHSTNSKADLDSDSSNDSSRYFISQLSQAIEKLDPVWTSSAILVAPNSYHSMNLELPFSDDKSISKVLSLEAQDRLPFMLEEFFISHKVLGARPDNQFDVLVTITSKDEIGNLLSNCQQAGLDPVAITTVSSLIGAKVEAAPDKFAQNSVFFVSHGSKAYLTFRIFGELKSERVFDCVGLDIAAIASEIQRSIALMESRYSVQIEEIWTDSKLAELDQLLSERCGIEIKSLNTNSDGANLMDGFISSCQDGKVSGLFVNLRSGQFSQTLRWGELRKITAPAFPYLLMFLFMSAAILFAIYTIREREAEDLQRNIIAKVQPLLPDAKLVPGQLVKTIQLTNDTIEKQLKDLGSPSKFSPLDVLSEVSRDFASIKDITVTSVTIRGTQLTVDGTSTNYENVDAIDKVLQSKRTLYCRPSKQVSGTGTRQFTFTITLCD